MQWHLVQAAVRWLRVPHCWASQDEIHEVMRVVDGYVPKTSLAEPLGERGGVPDFAGAVDTHAVLSTINSAMAKQVLCPKMLLLRKALRPKRLLRTSAMLDGTYKRFVLKMATVGLQKLVRPSRVWKHNGKPMIGGCFAVPKSPFEQRVISNLPVNQLVDPARVPRPVFAYPPRLRSVYVPLGAKVLLYKRDLRHYFHQLRIGRRWFKYLAHPSIEVEGQEMVPLHTCAPMGFSASSGWAQEVSNAALKYAQLPAERRAAFDTPVPEEFPIWGSIIDDLWALALDQGDGRNSQAESWMNRAEGAFEHFMIPIHHGKTVQGDTGEFQGATVEGSQHDLGVSHRKRALLFAATLHFLSRRCVTKFDVQRMVGKHAFVHSFRPSCRSIFSHCYTFLQALDGVPARQSVVLPGLVWEEFVVSCILLPLMVVPLSVPWNCRLMCSDAAPGGHGLAWAAISSADAAQLGRLADMKTVHARKTEFALAASHDEPCLLSKITLPKTGFWHEVARKGGYKHIVLEEASAKVWGMAERLYRPAEYSTKIVHAGDNVAVEAAFAKGRSRVRKLNTYCRRGCAIELCGNFTSFHAWISTHSNPADRPSRRYAIAPGESVADAQPGRAVPGGLVSATHVAVTVRFVSTQRCSVSDGVQAYFASRGVLCWIVTVLVDPFARDADSSFNRPWHQIRDSILSAQCCGLFIEHWPVHSQRHLQARTVQRRLQALCELALARDCAVLVESGRGEQLRALPGSWQSWLHSHLPFCVTLHACMIGGDRPLCIEFCTTMASFAKTPLVCTHVLGHRAHSGERVAALPNATGVVYPQPFSQLVGALFYETAHVA
eukprot:2280884-Amphidinium_carterae.1